MFIEGRKIENPLEKCYIWSLNLEYFGEKVVILHPPPDGIDKEGNFGIVLGHSLLHRIVSLPYVPAINYLIFSHFI